MTREYLGAHSDDAGVGIADWRGAVVHVRLPVGPGVRASPSVVGKPPRARAVDCCRWEIDSWHDQPER